MRKRPKKKIEQPVDEVEMWLISYADMMTLIACFFILMMAFANYDPVGFNIKAEKLSQAFRKDKFKSSSMELNQLQEEIASHPQVKQFSKITMQDGALIVTFSGSVLFQAGSYKIEKHMSPIMDAMIDLIKNNDPNYRIIISGHSDSSQIEKDELLGSEWLMSMARSTAIVERFLYFGFSPENLVAVGHGPTRPTVPRKTKDGKWIKENQSINRRVIVKILRPKDKSQKKVKLGLGVYFNSDANEQTDQEVIDQSY
ncbi:OmpA family protein [Bacteriovoracaceae bacterium]|nr:OmpA family protein [Bacteriovoracaceae bacterium]